MKLFLTMGPDGRILVQSRIEIEGALGYVLHYVNQGEDYNGVPYDQLAQSTPGSMEVPEQPDGSNVEPDTSGLEPEQPPEQEPEQQPEPTPGQ